MSNIAYSYGEGDKQTIIVEQDNVTYRMINLADSMEKALSSQPKALNVSRSIRMLSKYAVLQLIDESGGSEYVWPGDPITLKALSKRRGTRRTLRLDAPTAINLSWLSLRTSDGISYPLGYNRTWTPKLKWDISPQVTYSLVIAGGCFEGYINTRIEEES